jgi:ATP-dependent exoDNAse (exonuclease V) beta subunit
MSLNEGQLSLTEALEPAAETAEPDDDRGFEPTAEQAAATAARSHDAFLEAGAGTGKTTVLVDRYCASVIDDGVDVDSLLAFTFTERAAAEMRGRVRRELTRRSHLVRAAGDRHGADALRAAARATERAWVMTIHAFCRRLLATHPLAAGLDPRFRVLDAAEAARLRDRAITEAIDGLLAAGDDEVARAAAHFEPWRLTVMTLGAYERLRSQGMIDPRLPEVGDPQHSPGRNEELRELTPQEVEAANAARAALERILEAFHRRYTELKDERSALDFADLELHALELLRSSPAVAAAWRGRFAHVMVDEFQDTNRVQLDLVEQLRDDDTRVFMVGDEHQSIYRFRNADLDVFREERRLAHDSPEREVLPLRGNFRSLPNVLAAVNLVGETLLDDFAPLISGRPPDQGAGSIELLLTRDRSSGDPAIKWDAEEIDLDPAPSASPQHIVAEARRLAQRLRELVDAGEAERGEIVVLLRAFTHVDAHEQALRRAGLRPFVVGGRGYWTQQQVEDVIRLLGSIANPLDDEHLIGALASFAAGVSPDALWLLRRAARSEADHPRHIWPVLEWRYGDAREPDQVQAHWLEAIPAADDARLRRFCSILAGLRRRAMLSSLEELIETTMTAFGYDLGLIAREGGPGRMANVRKLMRLARDFEANEGRDLRGFIALAQASTRRDEREGMAAVQSEGHDGVRVMTVHAAKGLQFPVVAVPDLGRALNAGRRNADLVIGPLTSEGRQRFGMRLAFASDRSLGLWELAELNSLEGEAESEEGGRLVYVAASRAEDRLILSGVYSEKHLEAAEPRPGDTPLQRLLPALGELGWDGDEGTVTLPGPAAIETEAPRPDAALAISVDSPDPERARELRLIMPPPPQNDPLAAPAGPPPLLGALPTRVPVGHLSYSAVSLYESCGYRFYVERVLGAREGPAAGAAPRAADDDLGELEIADEMPDPGPPRALALGIGNTVHAALEWSARHDWRAPDGELIARLLAREGLEGEVEATQRIDALVTGWLGSELCAELGGGSLRPEVPFALGIGATVIRGQIDLLATGEGLPCVVDYKTDGLHGRAPAELAQRYRAQREIYALAVGAERGARVAHVFLEAPDQPVIEELGVAELDAARVRLEGLIERMAGAEFVVAADPYAALCFGCPAAARLCPRPAWRPGRT